MTYLTEVGMYNEMLKDCEKLPLESIANIKQYRAIAYSEMKPKVKRKPKKKTKAVKQEPYIDTGYLGKPNIILTKDLTDDIIDKLTARSFEAGK